MDGVGHLDSNVAQTTGSSISVGGSGWFRCVEAFMALFQSEGSHAVGQGWRI